MQYRHICNDSKCLCVCARARARVYVYVCVGFAQVEEKVCRLEENRSID